MKKLNLSENTSVGLPLKNLLSLIGAIIVGSYFAFGVLERLNNLETADILFKEDLLKRVAHPILLVTVNRGEIWPTLVTLFLLIFFVCKTVQTKTC